MVFIFYQFQSTTSPKINEKKTDNIFIIYHFPSESMSSQQTLRVTEYVPLGSDLFVIEERTDRSQTNTYSEMSL